MRKVLALCYCYTLYDYNILSILNFQSQKYGTTKEYFDTAQTPALDIPHCFLIENKKKQIRKVLALSYCYTLPSQGVSHWSTRYGDKVREVAKVPPQMAWPLRGGGEGCKGLAIKMKRTFLKTKKKFRWPKFVRPLVEESWPRIQIEINRTRIQKKNCFQIRKRADNIPHKKFSFSMFNNQNINILNVKNNVINTNLIWILIQDFCFFRKNGSGSDQITRIRIPGIHQGLEIQYFAGLGEIIIFLETLQNFRIIQ